MTNERRNYRYAMTIAVVATLLLMWINGAVGIIGADGDPANLMYFGVIAVGLIGAAIARLQPLGMARTLFAMAVAQALVAAIAIILGFGLPYSPPLELVLLNGFFVALFVGSAMLFLRAAQERVPEGAGLAH